MLLYLQSEPVQEQQYWDTVLPSVTPGSVTLLAQGNVPAAQGYTCTERQLQFEQPGSVLPLAVLQEHVPT